LGKERSSFSIFVIWRSDSFNKYSGLSGKKYKIEWVVLYKLEADKQYRVGKENQFLKCYRMAVDHHERTSYGSDDVRLMRIDTQLGSIFMRTFLIYGLKN